MKSDRRTIYTKKVIKDALYTLLEKNSLKDITVKEICGEAGINRATFYRNYKDIYDLFENIESEMIQAAFPKGFLEHDKFKLLNIIYDNQIFYKEFFNSHIESVYIRSIIEKMYDEAVLAAKEQGKYDEKVFRISFQYMLHGILGILREWVKNGCIEPPEELAGIILEISRKQFQ